MYISKKNREIIKAKYGGLCAYSGTVLEDDWQVEHIKPLVRNWDGTCQTPQHHDLENLVPVQRIINHYKHSLSLELFRNWLLGNLHQRLQKLPKTSKSEKTIKRKEYLLQVAAYFGISEEQPFSGKFYFEEIR